MGKLNFIVPYVGFQVFEGLRLRSFRPLLVPKTPSIDQGSTGGVKRSVGLLSQLHRPVEGFDKERVQLNGFVPVDVRNGGLRIEGVDGSVELVIHAHDAFVQTGGMLVDNPVIGMFLPRQGIIGCIGGASEQ
nr:hypothetical protein [Bacteroides reticulotermitis]